MGYSPTQMAHAYGFDLTDLPGSSTLADGTGQTIAIVDAYDDPNIAADLATFDVQYGLPTPSLVKMSQTGSTTNLPLPDTPSTTGSWDLEIALDVEWTHALAPGANIVLVECNSSGLADLMTGINTARNLPGVSVISMSFGVPEALLTSATETADDATLTTPAGHQGITFVAATGDSGQPGDYPAYSPNVLAVGGTTLNLDSSGNVTSETGWSGSGGGVSTLEPQPAYQTPIYAAAGRATPDVAFDADPNTGAAVVDSYDFGATAPWVRVGGTSLAAPSWAGLIALTDQARATLSLGSLDGASQTLPTIYAAPASDFNDILSGNNGFAAGPGYDLVTGRGSPRVPALINDLVGPFKVVATTPAVGSLLTTPPTDFAVTFSSPYVASEIDATDFLVNGVVPDSFALTSPTTVTFHYDTSPVTTQGLQTMSIGAGAVDRQVDNSPLVSFSGTFRYNTVTLSVDQASPPAGTIVNLPLSSITLHFNEAFDPSSVGASDLTLSQGTVSGYTIVDPQTVQYALSGVTNPGALTVTLPTGAVTDPYGDACAGFSETLYGNAATTAFPTLTQLAPAGSRVYQNSVSGNVLFANNTYSYALSLAGGQTLSLVAQSSAGLQAQLSLTGPGVSATATATSPGATAVLSPTAIHATGVYTLTITGAAATTGRFVLTALLDATPAGSLVSASNHSLASAISLDSALISLGESSLQTGVVSIPAISAVPDNSGYGATPVPYRFEDISATGTIISFAQTTAAVAILPRNGTQSLAFPFFGTTFSQISVGSNGLLTFGRFGSNPASNSDLSATPTQAAIAPLWDSLTIGGSPNSNVYYQLESSGRLVIEWQNVSFTGGPQNGATTFEAFLNPDGTIQFNYQSYDPANLRSGDTGPTVGIKNVNTSGADPLLVSRNAATGVFVGSGSSIEIGRNIIPATSDDYSVTLAAGQTVALAVRSQNGVPVQVALESASGATLSAGAPVSGGDVDQMTTLFTAPTGGVYYAVVTGGANAAYSLVVTKNAVLSSGADHASTTAQNLTGAQGAAGYIAAGVSDWYSLNLTAGATIVLQANSLVTASAQPVGNLQPQIQLYRPDGTLIGSAGANASLQISAPTSGVYTVQVSGAANSTGEYFLSSLINTPPEVGAVYLGGSGWSSAFLSALAADGLGDAQLGYRLQTGAGQLTPLPWTTINTISVQFTQDVSVNTAQAGLSLIGSTDLAQPSSLAGATFTYSSTTHVAQWVFASPLVDDKYLLYIPSAAVNNSLGVALDGEFVNSSSGNPGGALPSGNGAAGGDFGFRFNLLPGNATQSGTVTGLDGNGVRIHLLQSATDPGYSPFYDLDANGAITGVDGSAVRIRLLNTLPSTDPTPPQSGGSGGGSAAPAVAPATTTSPTSVPAPTTSVSTPQPASTAPPASSTPSPTKPAHDPIASTAQKPAVTLKLPPLSPADLAKIDKPVLGQPTKQVVTSDNLLMNAASRTAKFSLHASAAPQTMNQAPRALSRPRQQIAAHEVIDELLESWTRW